jgi:undecaprenyl-diphosphatase
MTFETIFDALLLGVIEGATEYLPVSSTGHLIVFVDLLGFIGPPGKIFEIVIQVGAVLAVCILYFRRLLGALVDFPTDPGARRFVYAIVIAFLPAAVIGVLLHKVIKAYLFSPEVVAGALIVGGVAILVIERLRPDPRVRHIEEFSLPLALGIGFIQCIAMIPGVSRSGATILGALLLGVERRTAAEFSFFLAIPTLTGAAVYDLWANRATLTTDGAGLILIGFVVSLVVAMVVVRWLIGFVGRHGFGVFAWYRIVFGLLLFAILYLR